MFLYKNLIVHLDKNFASRIAVYIFKNFKNCSVELGHYFEPIKGLKIANVVKQSVDK